jgi:hypothetical protein
MNKTIIVPIVAAVVFGGAGFWGGMTYAASQRPSFAGGNFAGRGGAGAAGGFARGGAGGGATFGTILSVDNGSFTVQLPTATTTGAASGTKLVLFNSSTQVSEMQSVPTNNLKAGQNVTVTGTANSDGSITASSVMVRPAGTGARGGPTQTTGQ